MLSRLDSRREFFFQRLQGVGTPLPTFLGRVAIPLPPLVTSHAKTISEPIAGCRISPSRHKMGYKFLLAPLTRCKFSLYHVLGTSVDGDKRRICLQSQKHWEEGDRLEQEERKVISYFHTLLSQTAPNCPDHEVLDVPRLLLGSVHISPWSNLVPSCIIFAAVPSTSPGRSHEPAPWWEMGDGPWGLRTSSSPCFEVPDVKGCPGFSSPGSRLLRYSLTHWDHAAAACCTSHLYPHTQPIDVSASQPSN